MYQNYNYNEICTCKSFCNPKYFRTDLFILVFFIGRPAVITITITCYLWILNAFCLNISQCCIKACLLCLLKHAYQPFEAEHLVMFV
jgi:hypothetical protein